MRREKPKSVGEALSAVMAAEQELLCAYERALHLMQEGTPAYAAIEDLYGKAVGASMDTQRVIFTSGSGPTPADLLRRLGGGDAPEPEADEGPGPDAAKPD